MQPTTFVTVAHEIDYELLKIQARSLDLYADPSIIKQIIVVENFTPGKELDWRAELLTLYGSLATRVRFVRSVDLVDMPTAYSGWWTQQVLKLVIAKEITTEWYVTFDAKNQLVNTLRGDFFCSPDGKPTTKLRRGYRTHPQLLDHFQRVLAYFEINVSEYLDDWMPTTTPFILMTWAVRHLTAEIEHRERKPFAQAFLDRQLTEYFSYAAHLIKCGISHREAYSDSQKVVPVIWEEQGPYAKLVRQIIRAAETHEAPVFGVHRGAIDAMPPECGNRLADFWTQHRLFESRRDALAAMERLRSVLH
jgi:hypothetical protein